MLGSIEGGGTKFVLAVGDENFNIVERVSFPTEKPLDTLKEVFKFFDKYEDIKSIGIGSFGPIDINKKSPTYGFITSTPKPYWNNFDFLGEMKKKYNIPIGWTTDVNIACLGEYEMGSAKDVNSAIYLTVGTGIGGGAIINGKFLEGFSHPEMGHIFIKKHPEDHFEGSCPYHKDCLEGLVAGPSLQKRYGLNGRDIDENDEVWKFAGYYLAQSLISYTLTIRPEKIILGGGIMKQPQVLKNVKKYFVELLNGYVQTPNIDEYIVRPSLGDDVGIVGGLILAKNIL